jgi:nuclear pore complex protein Nup98-Nup96
VHPLNQRLKQILGLEVANSKTQPANNNHSSHNREVAYSVVAYSAPSSNHSTPINNRVADVNTLFQPCYLLLMTTSVVFGNTQPAPSGGLFGNTGGLFGNATQQQQQQQQQSQQPAFGLFKNPTPTAPTGGGLFGNFGQQGTNANASTTPGQTSSLFGNTLSTNQQPQTGGAFGGGSLFGKPAASTMGTSTSMGQNGGGGSLFGNPFGTSTINASATAPGVQGSLTASISQPIGANLPIFSMLPPGPRALDLDQPKKKAGFFVDVPTRSPVPRLQLGYTPANTKLRGFGDSTAGLSLGGQGTGNGFSSSGLSFPSGKANALSLSRAMDNKTPVGPDAFLGRSSSPSLGSGNKQSVKKLILDKKVEPADLFSKSGGSPGVLKGTGKVTFNPAMSVAAREKEAASSAASPPKPTFTAGARAHNRFTAHSTQNVLETESPVKGNGGVLAEGAYWVKPELQTLIHAGHDELLAFKDLVVGRVGYGEIHFLEPVDLTGLPRLGALLGEFVRFENKECSVYPDVADEDKPPAGTGLNVRARMVLLRCWPDDKATQAPIKDENHPSAAKQLKRLKKMKGTHFESFDWSEGKWTFTVDHF